MMSAPAPYPSVASNQPAPDDAQIETRMPSICVDYLSHNWTDEDVWSSWKVMTKRKNEIANGVRLENASWRTWAKQRGKLKTISPETLNWLKDSDVTWLYGPLHEHVEAVPPPRIATASDRLGLDGNAGGGGANARLAAAAAATGKDGSPQVISPTKERDGLALAAQQALGTGNTKGEAEAAGAAEADPAARSTAGSAQPQRSATAPVPAGGISAGDAARIAAAAASDGYLGVKGPGVAAAAARAAAAGAPAGVAPNQLLHDAPVVSSPGSLGTGTPPSGAPSPSAATGPAGSSFSSATGGSGSSAGGGSNGLYGYVNNSGKKSILKHRTISDILSHPGRMASPSSGDMMALFPPSVAAAYYQQQAAMQQQAAAASSASGKGGMVEAAVRARQARDDAMVAGNLRHPHEGSLQTSRSDTHLVRLGQQASASAAAAGTRGASPDAGDGVASARPGDSSAPAGSPSGLRSAMAAQPKEKKHISFNQRVEQCVAVDHDLYADEIAAQQAQQRLQQQHAHARGGFDYDEEEDEDEDDDDAAHNDHSDASPASDEEDATYARAVQRRAPRAGSHGPDSSDEDDELLTMKSSPRTSGSSDGGSSSSLGFRRSHGFADATSSSGQSEGGASTLSRPTSSSSAYSIIAKIAPTRLKTSEAYPSPSPAVVDPTGFTTGAVTDWIQGGGETVADVQTYPDPGTYGPMHFPGAAAAAEAAAAAASSKGGKADGTGSHASSPSAAAHHGPRAVVTARPVGAASASSQWGDADDDLHAAGDFDYFSGPDLGDDYQPAPGQSVHSHHAHAPGSSAFSPSGSSDGGNDAASPGSVSSSPENSRRGARRDREASADDPAAAHDDGGLSSPPASGYAPGAIQIVRNGSSSNAVAYDDGSGAPGAGEGESRGRTSQRLGSSASYERIQDAAGGGGRQPRSRTGSSGSGAAGGGSASSSLSPTGSFDGAHGVPPRSAGSGRSGGPGSSPQAQRGVAAAAAGTARGGSGGSSNRRGPPPPASSSSYAAVAASRASVDSDSDTRGSFDMASPNFPASPLLGQGGSDSEAGLSGNYWADDQPGSRSSSKSKKAQAAARQKYKRSIGQSVEASASELSVDTANVPSNNPASSPQEVGPTPLNTPTFALARSRSGSGGGLGPAPHSPTVPRKPNSTGALVAPRREDGVRVPLADDYVDEDEGGLIGRAVEIVNTARDLIGALLGTGGDRARSWRE